jgi:hypothetical protein
LCKLSLSDNETPQVLTLARPDEKSLPAGPNKKSQVRENAQETFFSRGEEF